MNGHTDSVLDVAHNQNMPHVLASGGADRRTILWDLDATSVHTVFKRGLDKVRSCSAPFPTLPTDTQVQSLDWHAHESALLATGDMSGTVGCFNLMIVKMKSDQNNHPDQPMNKGVPRTHPERTAKS